MTTTEVPVGILPAYLAGIVEVPRDERTAATAEFFATVATAATDDEREDLYERVVMVNACVARSLAQRYEGHGIALDDLEQVAYLALTVAARRFDPVRGHDFLQYAVPSISGTIKRYFRDFGWTIRVPRQVQEVQRRIAVEIADPLVDPADVSSLATRLGLPPASIEDALRARGCFHPTSLDLSVGEGGGLLGDLVAEGPDEHAAAEARAMLLPLLASMSSRDREIVRMRYEEDLTQRAMGERLGATQVQVSRMLNRVHERLRQALTEGPTATAS